jgi:hypothetical protein
MDTEVEKEHLLNSLSSLFAPISHFLHPRDRSPPMGKAGASA